MEIVGINSKLSGPGRVALILQPSLTSAIFDEIRRLTVDSSKTPLLSSLEFENVGGCLVFRCVGAVSENVRSNIVEMLKRAEEEAETRRKAVAEHVKKTVNLEQAQKGEAVNSAAQIFGVPIK